MSEIGVGLIGLGTVGSGVVGLLGDSPAAMQRRKHAKFSLRAVAVRDPGKKREVSLDGATVTSDAMAVVDDPDVDVVVELTGAPPAYEWIRASLERGKDVVTANKAVVAEHGGELFDLALEKQAELMFEASVAAGIPCKALGFWTLIWRMVRPPWTTPAGSSGAPGLASDSCVARGATSRCRLS